MVPSTQARAVFFFPRGTGLERATAVALQYVPLRCQPLVNGGARPLAGPNTAFIASQSLSHFPSKPTIAAKAVRAESLLGRALALQWSMISQGSSAFTLVSDAYESRSRYL